MPGLELSRTRDHHPIELGGGRDSELANSLASQSPISRAKCLKCALWSLTSQLACEGSRAAMLSVELRDLNSAIWQLARQGPEDQFTVDVVHENCRDKPHLANRKKWISYAGMHVVQTRRTMLQMRMWLAAMASKNRDQQDHQAFFDRPPSKTPSCGRRLLHRVCFLAYISAGTKRRRRTQGYIPVGPAFAATGGGICG